MHHRWRRRLLLVACALMPAPRAAQSQLLDLSPHTVRLVSVEPSVQLEVLDWGGTGPPMVFLAGLGSTAHTFDEFAPRFRDGFHTYGITRRGFGRSTHSSSGYDPLTRVRDIRTVLDSLGVQRAVMVGHAFAGEELTQLATDDPQRVRALVYLDGAYSYAPDTTRPPPPPQASPLPTRSDSASANSFMDFVRRRYGVRPPAGEVQEMAWFGPDGRLQAFPPPGPQEQILKLATPPDYRRIQAPALAIYVSYSSPRFRFPGFDRFDARNRDLARIYTAAQMDAQADQMRWFRAWMRRGQVVQITDANPFLYYSNAEEVEGAIRTFLALIPPDSTPAAPPQAGRKRGPSDSTVHG